jgi:hypothetical protein
MPRVTSAAEFSKNSLKRFYGQLQLAAALELANIQVILGIEDHPGQTK